MYTQMADGKTVVAANMIVGAPKKERRLLIVLQYWEGDKQAVIEQASLIADLERFQNKQADIMLFRRNDASVMPQDIIQKLKSKFLNVFDVKSRRLNVSGYPYGANEMFYDLASLVGNAPIYTSNYFAFINLESDCCPTKPGWINDLVEEFRRANAEGYRVIGHLNQKPVKHFNGVCVYDIDLINLTGNKLVGGPANSAYDIHHAETILPIAKDTPLIVLDFKRPTITAEDLFSPIKGLPCALFHGVKDSSAIQAVRSKYVTLDVDPDLSHKTVTTYFDPVDGIDKADQLAQIEIWKASWESRGWNPVVIGWLEAAKHPLYEKFLKKVESFPTINNKKYEVSCFLRWLALDQVGGGFMTDYDVLPGRLMPRDIVELRKNSNFNVLQLNDGGLVPSCVYSTRKALKPWIKYILDYTPSATDLESGMPHVSDQSVVRIAGLEGAAGVKGSAVVKEVGEEDWIGAPAVHFATGACRKYKPGTSKTAIMRAYASNN